MMRKPSRFLWHAGGGNTNWEMVFGGILSKEADAVNLPLLVTGIQPLGSIGQLHYNLHKIRRIFFLPSYEVPLVITFINYLNQSRK